MIVFNLDIATVLGEGKFWIQTCQNSTLKIDLDSHLARAEGLAKYIYLMCLCCKDKCMGHPVWIKLTTNRLLVINSVLNFCLIFIGETVNFSLMTNILTNSSHYAIRSCNISTVSLQWVKTPNPKMVTLQWWWGSSSWDLGSGEHSFIAITPRTTLTWSFSTC